MNIIKKYVIDVESVDIGAIIKELRKFKEEIIESIHNGETKFLPNAAIKDIKAYKDPAGQQSVKASFAWNIFYPDNQIEFPSKISIIKLNIFDEEDIEDMKETNPKLYDLIIDKIFNDKSGIFVRTKEDPPIQYLADTKENRKNFTKLIPEKMKTKYGKYTIKEWNKYVDTVIDDPDCYKGSTIYKKQGLQVLGIPSNAKIPDWCMPYIDEATIVNNILAPFIPILEIFKAQTIEEGKTIKGVNRKTRRISNIIKF